MPDIINSSQLQEVVNSCAQLWFN